MEVFYGIVLILIFFLGWVLGRSEYVNNKITPEEKKTLKELEEELKISVGNANMNIRALIDWGLVHKELIPGHRKEFFIAEKDMWEVAVRIIRERRRKEVDPVVRELKSLSDFNAEGFEAINFKKLLEETHDLAVKLNGIGDMIERVEKYKFVKWVVKGV